MKSERKVTLMKVESTPGTDAVPVAGTDAIQAIDFAWTEPGKATVDEYTYAAQFYGSREKFVVSLQRACSFVLPVIGGGTALGTPYPAAMLAAYRACGHAQVINAGVSVVLSPVSTGEESLTLAATEDGFLRKLLMGRGSMKWEFGETKVPRAMVALMGLYSTPADQAMPTPTFPTLVKPVGFNKSNTTVTLGGVSLRCSSVVIDGGRTHAYRNMATVEDVIPQDCRPTVELKFELPTATGLNVYQMLETATIQALAINHGTVAFNKFGFAAPRANLADLNETKDRGVMFLTAKLELLPNVGNDQYTITLT